MTNCAHPACDKVLPATYAFTIDDSEDEVKYCSRCVAFCITQDYFTIDEVDSLRKLTRKEREL